VVQARKVAEQRKGRSRQGRQGRSGRGKSASRAIRADADAGVSTGERLDADQVGEGLGNGSLAQSNQRLAAYSRLRLKAETALEILISADGVPANVRASAVRTALELVGAIGSKAKDQRDQEDSADDLDPERLSIEDIDRAIRELGRV
jgi:hypothetical protein